MYQTSIQSDKELSYSQSYIADNVDPVRMAFPIAATRMDSSGSQAGEEVW